MRHLLAPLNSYFTNFGDQGIVITRAFYDTIGEMPDMPLFEDVELFWRGWLHGARLQVLDAPVYTSSRRFEAEGALKQILKDTSLMLRYATGTELSSLVRGYGEAPRLQ